LVCEFYNSQYIKTECIRGCYMLNEIKKSFSRLVNRLHFREDHTYGVNTDSD